MIWVQKVVNICFLEILPELLDTINCRKYEAIVGLRNKFFIFGGLQHFEDIHAKKYWEQHSSLENVLYTPSFYGFYTLVFHIYVHPSFGVV